MSIPFNYHPRIPEVFWLRRKFINFTANNEGIMAAILERYRGWHLNLIDLHEFFSVVS
jgi:hypothetical protein